jgi:hypothetical protein
VSAPVGEGTEVFAYAPLETATAVNELDLSKVVAFGGTYRFAIVAVDEEGRVSPAALSNEVVVGVAK